MNTDIPQKAPPRRPVIVWDLIVSIVLLVFAVATAFVLAFFGMFLPMMSDACGAVTECNYAMMEAGWLVALFAPALVTVVAIVVAIILMVKRRVSFWVPLVALALEIGLWIVGVAIMAGGVPGARL